MSIIHPVLLCGGSGTRLWPLSRQSYPKQFVPLTDEGTLFQAAARRMAGEGYAAPTVITASDFRFIVTEQLAEVGIDPNNVLIEPEGRNTGPAVLVSAMHLARTDPEAMMLVAPSDHVVPDAKAFRAHVATGLAAAQAGRLVTFGVAPTRAETGYGYLELGAEIDGVADLKRFVEKPDAGRAEAMLTAGTYLWNAGIFLFTARAIIAAFERHAPELVKATRQSLEEAKPDLGFLRLAPAPWAQLPDISIDYAVMERAGNLAVVPFRSAWSDLGDWDAVRREAAPDATGVVTAGRVTAIDCADTLLRSEDEGLELVGLGLTNIVAVAMPDAVLIADASRAQDVKDAVVALKRDNVRQATMAAKDHRPWGWFESLVVADRFRVKRILVHPGASLSLQSHHHRAEHWIVVQGTARVTVDAEVKLVSENESVYIPLGAVHRMENPGKLPMILIEVQTGAYLGEDDIIRYEDAYARD